MRKYRVTNADGSFQDFTKKPTSGSFEIIDFDLEISIEVPAQISRMNFIIQVFLVTGLKYEDIVSFIQNLPEQNLDEASKYIVLTKLRGCVFFERHSEDLLLIAQMMGISDAQLDEIFTNGKTQ